MTPLFTHRELARASTALRLAVETLDRAARCQRSLAFAATPGCQQIGGHTFTAPAEVDPLRNTREEIDAKEATYIKAFAKDHGQAWIDHMTGYIRRSFARATPTNDAIRAVPKWLDRAIECRYPVFHEPVREALCQVILAERTEGWVGLDTTGTQIGNFSPTESWRGGGFLNL